MGNSNSVTINDFQNQLISSCLWSLRHQEIREHYHKNRNQRLMLNTQHEIVDPNEIPQLYQPNLLTKKFHPLTTHMPIYLNTLDNDPKKTYTKMINEYLYHILQNKEEVDKLIQEIIARLNPPNLIDIGGPDSVSLDLPENFQNNLTDSNNSYNNLLN